VPFFEDVRGGRELRDARDELVDAVTGLRAELDRVAPTFAQGCEHGVVRGQVALVAALTSNLLQHVATLLGEPSYRCARPAGVARRHGGRAHQRAHRRLERPAATRRVRAGL
jgi:hypothetical protein